MVILPINLESRFDFCFIFSLCFYTQEVRSQIFVVSFTAYSSRGHWFDSRELKKVHKKLFWFDQEICGDTRYIPKFTPLTDNSLKKCLTVNYSKFHTKLGQKLYSGSVVTQFPCQWAVTVSAKQQLTERVLSQIYDYHSCYRPNPIKPRQVVTICITFSFR